ncbi:MAG: coniferyl aldehyde dehydrogenase [Legionella sp.]|nr:MAG: coniferyl aldehyde dehydrogenase [Legionella sp.]
MDLNIYLKTLEIEHANNPYPLLDERKKVLQALKKGLQEEALPLAEAVNKDFSHRAQEETLFLEVFPTLQAINFCLRHLKSWMKKRKREVSWLFFPAQAYTFPQPLGVVGIMVPWNYPLYLALVPAIYAVAAGNRVMIKMSELSPNLGLFLQSLIQRLELSDFILIVNGDVEVAKEFSALPFGHLLFTGSSDIGKQVMKTASENLTPVTLELGGKSPAILSRTMNPNYFARLFMGKLFNAAQTCVAPDYLLIPEGWEGRVEQELQLFLEQHYPRLIQNKDYTCIVSPHHKQRLLDLLEDARTKGAKVIPFGELESDSIKLPLYLLLNVYPDMRVMQEEIFGPLLPVVTYKTMQDAVTIINKGSNPLALYYFGEDAEELELLQTQTLSGALTINDTVMHVGIDDLPFGGVGQSGMGHYHGREGFDTFSKLKGIMIQRRLSPITWLYPPYGKLLRYFLTYIGGLKLK